MGIISKYKNFLLYIIAVLVTVFWVTIVFASNLVFDIKMETKVLSSNIFLDNSSLKSNLVVFTSSSDLSKFELSTSCDLRTKYLWANENDYFFSVSYNYHCLNPYLYLRNGEDILVWSNVRFNIYPESKLFSLFSDLWEVDLLKIKSNLEEENNLLGALKQIKDLNSLIVKRRIDENIYKLKLIGRIVVNRGDKYIVPILGHELSTRISKVPNSPRPYRETYTDGIHHGWDIDADFWEEVVALDEWVIVRVVEGFEFSDLSQIDYVDKSEKAKIKNLDILRWNQIWLKTSSWDVAFYSHLNEIYPNVKEGMIVSRGQALGTVWKTGIPDRNYTDFHLHFPIHKNPHNPKMIWKYTFDDYMRWDWYFKWESPYYVVEHQDAIFSWPTLSYKN